LLLCLAQHVIEPGPRGDGTICQMLLCMG
jgi:hypothetical protein